MSCIQLGGRSHISWTAQTYSYAREWCNKPEGPQCSLASAHHSSKPKYIHWLLLKLFFFFLISKNNTELKHIKPPLPQRHHLWNQGKHFQELLGRPSVCSQHRNPAQLYLLPLQIKHSCYLIYPDIFGSIFQAFETTSVFNQAFKMSSGGLVLS